LFERDADDDNSKIKVPDLGLDQVISGLFEQFNFTITESTPLDIEVAVDPEMLGKIFEELVTGRHESGSYYTPKPIVSFMCREALKGYLETQVAAESKDAVARFVDRHEPDDIRDAEAVLNALRRVTVCDPACGSGAYLLGMLHELLDLRECLFNTKKLDHEKVYDRKLEIIQKCIYGVDLDLFAVNIARLRLWLSLSVDFQGQIPLPLPNLDYKIGQGDSLTAPLAKDASAQSSFAANAIKEFLMLKQQHFNAHQQDKIALKQRAETKRGELATWVWGSTHVSGFDWSVMFAEIFVEGGFAIVMANPPYVRADAKFKHTEEGAPRQEAVKRWAKYRANLIRSGQYETLKEKWDLYIAFLERSLHMLQPGGLMAFIIPDAYNSNKYAEASHDLFLQNSTVRRIDFCSDVDIFNAGVSNTILLFKAGNTHGATPLRVIHTSARVEDFGTHLTVLESLSQENMGQALFRSQKRSAKTLFEHVPLSAICYISVGMVLNAHEGKAPGKFKAEDLISAIADKDHSKPYIEGKDLRRWITNEHAYLEYGTKRCPALVRRATFSELYEVPYKLISMDIASDKQRVTLDRRGYYHNHSAWSFVPWHLLNGIENRSIRKSAVYEHEVTSATMPTTTRDDLEDISRGFEPEYLCAVLNSSFATAWLASERRNKMHLYPDDWKQLPVPLADKAAQRRIAALVLSLQRAVTAGDDAWTEIEAKIDGAINQIISTIR